MRASLASATSLLALLLLDGRPAVAEPIIDAGTSFPFYYELGSTGAAGADVEGRGAAAESFTFSPLTTGATSTSAGFSGVSPYERAGGRALTSLIGVRINGPVLEGFQRSSSPGGKQTTGNSVFVETTVSARLLDGGLEPGSASASYGYTMAVPDTGSNLGIDQPPPDTAPGAAGSGWAGAAPDAAGADATSGSPAFAGTTTAVYDPHSKMPGGAVVNSNQPAPGGTVFSPIAGGPARRGAVAGHSPAVEAFYRMLQQNPNDANHADPRLTADGYQLTGADASAFSVWSRSDGVFQPSDDTVPVPMRAVGTGGGELPSSLTIFTAQSAAFEGGGDSLSYFFHHGITQ